MPRRTGPGRRSRRGSGRPARPPADARLPCRPSPGSPPAAVRPSGSRRRRPPRRSPRSRPGSRSPGGPRPLRRPAQPPRPRRCPAGRAPSGPSVVRDDRPDPEAVAGPRDPCRDLTPVGDEQGPDRRDGRRRFAIASRRRRRRTRQSRQSRHATVPQPAWQAAARSRSSAGRSASWPRSAPRPGLDSAHRTCVSRCRIFDSEGVVSPRRMGAPRRVGVSRRRRETPPAPPRSCAAGR